MATSHRALLKILETASRVLPQASPPVSRNQISEWIEERRFAELRAADQACREYISTRQWPSVENVVRAQLHLRVECAEDLCRGMIAESIPEETDEDGLLESLLIEYWRDRGPEWARSKFEEQ